MKRMLALLVLSALIVCGQMSAQYRMTLQNAAQLSPTQFQFDVYIVSTGANFNLTSYGLKLSCGSAIVNGGSLAVAYVAGSTALSFGVAAVSSTSSGGVTYLGVASNVGSQTVSTSALKVGTFQITNTTAFGLTPAAMQWEFTTPFPTTVNIDNAVATVAVNHVNALSPYRIVLLNDNLVGGNAYEFDVDIVRTTADFTLSSLQVCFTFNNAISNGGTLSFAYIAGSTTLSAITPQTPLIVTDGSTTNFLCGSSVGSQLVTGTQLRVGRFRITNTVAFAAAPMDLQWDFGGIYITQININSSNLTIPANHFNFLNNTPLPVELVSFNGRSTPTAVELAWKTATEVGNAGFEIQRRVENKDWQKIGFVSGHGTTNAPQSYAFTDKEAISGKVQYRLKQIDASGHFAFHSAIEVDVAPPSEWALLQNSPNPFNPSTTITYQLPAPAFVSISVFDMLGRAVASLVEEQKQPGTYRAEWNGRNAAGSLVSSGVYMYRMTAGEFSRTLKMNLMK